MKKRILDLDLQGVIDRFLALKWKLYSVDAGTSTITVEIPRDIGESFIVLLRYEGEEALKLIEASLRGADFIKQQVTYAYEW